MLTDDVLRANLHAGAGWSSARDLPDVVGWRDLLFADDLAVAVMRDRLSSAATPGRIHSLPLPKDYGPELRQMAIFDPYDDVIYRSLVSVVANDIDDALGDEVRSYRLAEPAPGWIVRAHQYAWFTQRAEIKDYLAGGDFGGLGTFDVRHYYPSISIDRLADVLTSVGANEVAITEIISFLAQLTLWGHDNGLPVGPEASGLLGNVFLVPVDQRLHAAGFTFSRYTDDYKVRLRGPRLFDPMVDLARDELTRLGLQMHPSKTRHLRTRSFCYTELYDREIDRVHDLLSAERPAGIRAVKELFEVESSSKSPKGKRIKFCLGVLRHERDAFAIRFAEEDLRLLRVEPKAWGRYLAPFYGKHVLDRDWMLSHAAAQPTKDTAAVQLHLLLACAAGHTGKREAQRIEELATTPSRDWVPVRAAAAEAWGRSDAWKPSKAADAVLNVGDTQHRRALALTLRHTDPGRARNKALRQLHNVVPECRPTVRWIEELADQAA